MPSLLELPKTGLLGKLKAGTREALVEHISVRKFRAGTEVVDFEDEKTNVYVLLEGTARAILVSDEGRLVAYRSIKEGDVFGEMAALTGQKRSASVEAHTDILVGVLSETAFVFLCESYSDFIVAIARELANLVASLTKRVFEQTTLEVRPRVARELVRIVRAVDKSDTDMAQLVPAPTHSSLAAQIGCEREAVTKALRQLDERGLIQKNRRNIKIPSIRALLIRSEI
ncbi:MAG: Crp/Fnr family transcriptional regulator [Paracoccaceae bacterium]